MVVMRSRSTKSKYIKVKAKSKLKNRSLQRQRNGTRLVQVVVLVVHSSFESHSINLSHRRDRERV